MSHDVLLFVYFQWRLLESSVTLSPAAVANETGY